MDRLGTKETESEIVCLNYFLFATHLFESRHPDEPYILDPKVMKHGEKATSEVTNFQIKNSNYNVHG